VTGKLHTAEVLPFLGVLWLLTKQFGVEGAAVAWTLRVAIDLLALIWSSGISWKTVASALPAFLSLIVSLAISRTLGDAGWQNFAVAAVAGAAVGAFGLYRSEDLRRAVSGPLNRLSRLSGLA
jgi:hypothetical protein